MTKQDLRHDSFVEGTARATAWLQNNFMTVLVAIVALAVLVVGTVYLKHSRERSNLQASQLLYRATSAYTSGDHGAALITLDEILSRFGSSSEGDAALYLAGASHLALGENDRALERLRAYLDESPEGMYARSARIGVALALESRGEFADAAQEYRAVRTSVEETDPLRSQAALGESRALEALGQFDAAIEVLQPVAGGQDFAARQEAEGRIAALRAQQR